MLDAAAVFLPQCITDPVQLIFNAPMTSPKFDQLGRTGLPTRKASDGVLHLGSQLAFAIGGSFQTNDLLEAWPTSEKGHDPRAGLKRTRDDSAMLFAVRLCLTQIPVGFTLTGGGKTNEGSRLPSLL